MARRNNRKAIVDNRDDQLSPYYLHPSDNPGDQLVSQVLIGSNYINWSISITTVLQAKNKFGFADGSLQQPDPAEILYPAWLRCNSMVVSWLRNSVSSQIRSSIIYLDDASAIWNDLRDRFSQGDSARRYQLRQQMMSLSQGQLDIGTYFTNLRVIWEEFKRSQPISWCSCEGCRCDSAAKWRAYQEQECTMQFLIGLNSSSSRIRSQILSTSPLPSLSKAFALVIQDERLRLIDGNNSSTYSHQPSVIANPYNRGRFLCAHCGKDNHTVDRCFSLHGFPPSRGRGRRKPTPRDFQSSKSINCVEDISSAPNMPSVAQCQQLIALLQSMLAASPSNTSSNTQQSMPSSSSSPFSGTIMFSPFVGSVTSFKSHWLLDTGATHHCVL